MSIKKFQEAHKDLAFSQNLIDKHRAQQMAQQAPMEQPQDMPQEAPVAPQNASEQTQVSEAENPKETAVEPKEEPSLVQTIKDTISPYIDDLKSLITKQGKETKQVEVKIAGELQSKDDTETPIEDKTEPKEE